jgi:hypothetical protein
VAVVTWLPVPAIPGFGAIMSAVGSKRKPSERPAVEADSGEEEEGTSALRGSAQRRRIDTGGAASGAGASTHNLHSSERGEETDDDLLEEGGFDEDYDPDTAVDYDPDTAAERVNPAAVKIADDPRMVRMVQFHSSCNMRSCHVLFCSPVLSVG